MSSAISVKRSRDLATPPSTVWALIGCFHALQRWHPSVTDAHNSGEATTPGALRVLTLEGGASIAEALIRYDGHARIYEYRILCSPLPVSDYVGALSVSNTESGCQVHWEGWFSARYVPDAEAKATIASVYDAGLQSLQELFSTP